MPSSTFCYVVVDAPGKDNYAGQFADPHPAALDPERSRKIVATIEDTLAKILKEWQNVLPRCDPD